jgi:hypothetical protein
MSLRDIADLIDEASYASDASSPVLTRPMVAGETKAPPSDSGLLVRCVKLRNDNYPGRGAHGILPVLVVGHEGMSEDAWKQWVRSTGAAAYGSAYAERCAREGVDLKEMTPTAPFGRSMRLIESPRSTMGRRYLDQAVYVLNVVEKWPSLYNLIAHTLGHQQMNLRSFVERISQLPSPHEVGEGQHSTLGDLIGRGMMLLPDY